jgi:acetylcholinesterase
LTANPPDLVARGSVANVPFIAGDCDDEGTIYALQSGNLTLVLMLPVSVELFLTLLSSTTEQVIAYFAEYFFRGDDSLAIASNAMQFYPADPAEGSPFNTGDAYAITPVYKQVAAFMGDVFYQAPRRTLLRYTSGKQPIWSYRACISVFFLSLSISPVLTYRLVSLIGKSTPIIGAVRSSYYRLCNTLTCAPFSATNSIF